MTSGDMAIGLIFLSQTTVGILGNLSVLYYLVLFHNESPLRSTDLILRHLAMANSLVILCKGAPITMTAFGWTHFMNDFGCKLFLYIERVGRSVSIAITCLLSIFQNITISPVNSCWRDRKVRASKYIDSSISLCWIMCMVVNLIFPIYVFGKQGSKNMTAKRDFGYCSSEGHDEITDALYSALFVFPEVVFSVLMVWSSGSMIFILYRHKQRVQHIHSIKVSLRSSPESRATQNILALVCTFVTFYTFSSMLHVGIVLSQNPAWWFVNATAFISLCFPTISPFLLLSRNYTLCRFCCLWIRNIKPPNHILCV